jgi:hypothetical protein
MIPICDDHIGPDTAKSTDAGVSYMGAGLDITVSAKTAFGSPSRSEKIIISFQLAIFQDKLRINMISGGPMGLFLIPRGLLPGLPQGRKGKF